MDINQSQANPAAGDYGEQPLNKTAYVCGRKLFLRFVS
jgi:hypothetical protein